MDILYLSGRSSALLRPGDGTGRALAERLARAAIAAGHKVRHVDSPVIAPTSVLGRVSDAQVEIALTQQVRHELPDLVHVLAFAGDSSAQTAWLAQRLGVPVLVSTDAAAVLCHRGDLLHEGREACTVHDDAARCALCCGLGRRATDDFLTRHEMSVGGLLAADLVVVPEARDAELLAAAGVPKRVLVVLPADAPWDAFAALYARFTASVQ